MEFRKECANYSNYKTKIDRLRSNLASRQIQCHSNNLTLCHRSRSSDKSMTMSSVILQVLSQKCRSVLCRMGRTSLSSRMLMLILISRLIRIRIKTMMTRTLSTSSKTSICRAKTWSPTWTKAYCSKTLLRTMMTRAWTELLISPWSIGVSLLIMYSRTCKPSPALNTSNSTTHLSSRTSTRYHNDNKR